METNRDILSDLRSDPELLAEVRRIMLTEDIHTNPELFAEVRKLVLEIERERERGASQ